MPDLTFLSAVCMAEQIREKRLSPVELVDAHLTRIQELNSKLNAFVQVDAEGARQQALLAEAAVRDGRELGVLHGVPLSIKSSIEVAGLRWEAGTKLRAGVRGERDAPLVARLRQATTTSRRRLPRALAALRARVEERLARVNRSTDLDPIRVAEEAAVLAERSDITEELVRLASHLAALDAALAAPGPVGKRIEFLLQEVHRELTTTGAKAGDLAIGELVLAAKAEAEKLREQVQNVE